MTAVEYAVLGLFFFALFLGYCFGRASALADAELERMRERSREVVRASEAAKRRLDQAIEQSRRDRLARAIEEGTAASHARPVGGVAEVVPFRRRENRDRIA